MDVGGCGCVGKCADVSVCGCVCVWMCVGWIYGGGCVCM